MQNEIKSIFEKSLNEGDFSSSQKNIKEKSFNRFIEQGFPNKRIEDWKFSDLNQIISANFENLDFSKKNIDKNVDVDLINEFEHNKIIFIDDKHYSILMATWYLSLKASAQQKTLHSLSSKNSII